MIVLGAFIVLPIMILLTSFVSDVGKKHAVASSERDGLVSIGALATLFADASAYERARACDRHSPSIATIEHDIAAVNADEARDPLGRSDWSDVAAAGSPSALRNGAAPLIDGLASLFPTIADRSLLTYDPDVAGIDLADSLTYRLPIAIEQLQIADRTLCAPGAATIAGRLVLAHSAGHAEGYLSDGLSETIEATQLHAAFARAIGTDQRRASAMTANALDQLSAFERSPDEVGRTRSAAATRLALRRVYALLRDTQPALDALIAERESDLARRRLITVLLGAVALLASLGIVIFGTRSALARAELARVKRTARELEYHATHDRLTGLPNRTAFVSAVDERLRAGHTVAILFIDLDNFKLVNDSLGHEAGDDVLCLVSRRLEVLAIEGASGFVARFGGDEFAMLVSDAPGDGFRARAEALATRVIVSVAEPLTLDSTTEQRLIISASVGLSFAEGALQKERRSADLLRDADAAMYEAKAAGRARAETFGPAMHERAVRKLALMTDLPGAAARGELALEFQRLVRLDGELTIGSEALLRWNHPKFGRLMPGAFIPIAEECGTLLELGRWAMEEAIRAFASGASPAGLMHVNVSVRELLEDDLDTFVESLLARYGVAARSVAVEVIEGALIRSGDRAERMLRRLRALGIKIWIDDFGVEYSSLRYLHRLPIDGVKIDRTFVGGTDGSLASPAIVRLIIELARSLELAVVAEGIETRLQREQLLALGCSSGQGYLFHDDPLSMSAP